jgi:hypothetical protein
MANDKASPAGTAVAPLSIEELEAGLRIMGEESTDLHSFWDEHIELFRKTVLFAIRDTSDALLSPRITLRWRVELESQLEDLVRYIELADRYIAKRFSCELPGLERPGSVTRIH